MEQTVAAVLALAIGVVIGIVIGRYLLSRLFKRLKENAHGKADLIVKEAEIEAGNLKKQKELEARELHLQLQAKHEESVKQKRNKQDQLEQSLRQNEMRLKQLENKLKQKDQSLSRSLEQHKREQAELKENYKELQVQRDQLSVKAEKLDELVQEQIARLEKQAGLSAEEARQQLVEALKDEARSKASTHVRDILNEAKLTATKEAKKLIITTIQRTAAEHAIENCVSVFHLESDEVKGKIIGREGRNIRAIEAATGIEVIVDDTPEAIIISGFDPVRREVARASLQKLVADGRIHPARVEEVVSKTRISIEDDIVELGERTAIDLGIHGLHPELIRMVGRMRYRSSYGQNLLQHSREVANLCAGLASELGLNVKRAKRAGLLHDIGKVWHEEPELPHALLGMQLAEKYGEHAEVCNAIGAHHNEIEMTTLISPIVQACDAISGSRPGARREMMESYIKRLKDLEELAMGFKGVNKCYAMQAGRELRIMVDAERVPDTEATQLSFDISQKIEREMQYPGQIKITVIREMRAVNFAK